MREWGPQQTPFAPKSVAKADWRFGAGFCSFHAEHAVPTGVSGAVVRVESSRLCRQAPMWCAIGMSSTIREVTGIVCALCIPVLSMLFSPMSASSIGVCVGACPSRPER